MRNRFSSSAAFAFVLSLTCLSSPGIAGTTSTVTIVNNSSFNLHHLFMSPTKVDEWGPDQLGEVILEADGGTFRLEEIPCATYDVKVIDHDGDSCVVTGIHLCDEDDVWNVGDDDLLECEGFQVDDDDDDDDDDGDE